MKALLLFGVLFISKSGTAPVSEDAQAKTLIYENTNNENGSYSFSFETSNGLYRRESGTVVNKGQPDEHILVEGQYSYNDLENNIIMVFYVAGPNGYNQTVWSVPVSTGLIDTRLNPNVVATFLG